MDEENNTLKIISIVVGMVLVVGIIAGLWYLQKPDGDINKCGDGVCDSVEKQKNICPEDCKGLSTEKACMDNCVRGDVSPKNIQLCKDKCGVISIPLNPSLLCSGKGIFDPIQKKCIFNLSYVTSCPDDYEYNEDDDVCEYTPDLKILCPEEYEYNEDTYMCEYVYVVEGSTCSQQNGNICSTSQTCSGSWLDASDGGRCCGGNCQTLTINYKYSPFGILPGIAPSGIGGKIILPKEQTAYINDLNVPILNLKHNPIDWDNIEKKQGVYDFSKSDEEIQLFLSASNDLMLTLEPWNELYGTREGHSYGVEDYAGSESDFYPENNLDDWSNFVEAVADRYCDSVKHYEFGHELAPWNPTHKGYWREHPDEYAEMFYLTHTALKKGCSDAKLFSVGAQSNKLIAKDFEDGEFFAQVFDEFNKNRYGKFNDIGIDYHLWRDKEEDYKDYGEYITAIKKFMQKYGYNEDDFVIVSTSMGGGMNDEPTQANFLIKTYISVAAQGQYLLFWQNIVENVAHTSFQYMGLMNNPYATDGLSHKKLSYYTYKLMVAKLEGSDWDNIQTIQESNNVYVYKFMKNGEPVWVLWNDNSDLKQITISGISSNQVKITEAVPKYETGQEVTDYSTAFNTETKTASGGKVEITLGESPVFIEGK